jgi:hypothetical protein
MSKNSATHLGCVTNTTGRLVSSQRVHSASIFCQQASSREHGPEINITSINKQIRTKLLLDEIGMRLHRPTKLLPACLGHILQATAGHSYGQTNKASQFLEAIP